MKKLIYNFLFSLLLLAFPATQLLAQVPTTSTDGNDVWYYINCSPRNTANMKAQWLTGAPDAGQILVSEFTQTDTQRWKVVAQGAGFALVNKAHGTYMNTDQTWNGAVPDSYLYGAAALPATPIKFVPTMLTYTGKSGVNIINASATVSAANVVDMATVTFQFYSAGSNVFMPISYGINPLNMHAGVFFMQDKDILKNAIDKVEKAITNAAEGYSPGQFSSDNIDGITQVLEESKFVYNDPATTADGFVAESELLLSVLDQFLASVITPQMSAGVDNWYYIQGTRPDNSYLTAGEAGAGTQVMSLPVIPDDTQLWKLVANGDGFALQNKANGEYIQAGPDFPSNTTLSTQSGMPALPLMFKASTQSTNKTMRFLVENLTGFEPAYRLHAGGPGHNYGLMTWTGDANDNSSWLFLGVDDLFRSEFKIALNKAKDFYNGSVGGVEFGQFPVAKLSALNDLIVAEEAKDVMEMTQEQLKSETDALYAAVDAFVSNHDLTTISTMTEKKWFRLVNNMLPVTGYAANKAMTSNARLANQKFTFGDIDEASDAQLFRFELNADKTAAIAMINKGDSVSYYMGADGMVLAENPGVTFNITILEDSISFWIKPTDAAPLHAAQSTDILNWNSAVGSASAWKFVYDSVEEVTDFETPFNAALAAARAKYNASLEFKGTMIGQYTAASMDAFNAIVTAEEAKNPTTMTKDQLIAGIQALNAAADVLVVANDVTLLENTNPALSYDWYRLVSAQSSGYAVGMAMSANGRITDETTPEPFTWEVKDEYSDAQLFRFELNAAKTHVANIYNKAAVAYVGAKGHLVAASTAGNEFEIVQLGNGRSFWIHPTLEEMDTVAEPNVMARLAPLHAASAGTHIVNWESGVGSASAWYLEYAYTEYTNSLSELDNSNFKVRVNEGVVTVAGVENFEVYSITGQKQNHKAALKAGVYIVKVNNMTQKLVIR